MLSGMGEHCATALQGGGQGGPCVERAAPRFSFSVWALLAAPSLATERIAMDDPNAIGPDGRVRLRCYLPSANSIWFSAGCDGQTYRSCCGR